MAHRPVKRLSFNPAAAAKNDAFLAEAAAAAKAEAIAKAAAASKDAFGAQEATIGDDRDSHAAAAAAAGEISYEEAARRHSEATGGIEMKVKI